MSDDHLLIKGVQNNKDGIPLSFPHHPTTNELTNMVVNIVHAVDNIIQHMGRLEDRIVLIEEMAKRDKTKAKKIGIYRGH